MSYFTALNAAMAHRICQPAPDAGPEVWANWWWEDADLWSEVARRCDDVWAAERAYDFAEIGRAEADRAAASVTTAPCPWR